MTAFFDRALEASDAEAQRRRQWHRLTALARALVPANPFVTRKWKAAGVEGAEDLRSWDDFSRLPFTRKAELGSDQAAHPPFGTNLTYPIDRYVRVHQTSGTSGVPLRWLDTQESWDWWIRCWSFVLRGAGIGAADRVFFPFSFGLFVGFWAGFDGARAIGALAIPGGGQDSAQRLAAIETLGTTAVCCTPSYALHLAEEARARGIDLDKLGVRTTVHAGEPGAGIPSVRARIEEAWGARAFDHAGMTEMGAYGFECAEQAGLHVNESEFIAEVIDPATGRAAPEGELVLTNLGRAGSPLLRYLTGDRVRVADGPCPCGRTFLRLAGGILGRVDDMLIVRGVNIFPSALEGIVRRFPAVDEFLIEVYRPREMDEVRILVDVARDGESVARSVQEAVRIALGIRVEVVPARAGSLPRYELKARRLVRKSGTEGPWNPPAPGTPDDAEDLIARIAAGDRDAFGRFYDAFAGMALGLIRRVLRDPSAAEDVLQEVFWQVWQAASRYDPRRGSPAAWVLMRARARAIDRLRSIRRREQTFVMPVNEAVARQDDAGGTSPAMAAESRGFVEQALAELPDAQRRVIELAFFEGLTQSEIAARLGEPLGTVKTRARLGLERLRTALRAEGEPGVTGEQG